MSPSPPDFVEWIVSVVLAAAVPTTTFLVMIHKLGQRISVLEYRVNKLNGTRANGTA